MRHESDMAPNLDRIANQMVTMDPASARRRPEGRRNYSEQGALAAAVMSNNPNDFTRLELEGNPAQRPPRTESAGDALKLQG